MAGLQTAHDLRGRHREMNWVVRLAVGQFLRHKLSVFLCALGVALGVGIVASIDSASREALTSFRASVDQVTGRATHQIVSADGAPYSESVFFEMNEMRTAPLAPVVDQLIAVVYPVSATVRVLGVDPFLESPFRDFTQARNSNDESVRGDWSALLTTTQSLAVSSTMAEKFNWGVGTQIAALVGETTRSLQVVAVLPQSVGAQGADIAIMDIAGAQELFGLVGKLDRIDVLARGDDAASLSAMLPPNLVIEDSNTRGARIEGMVESFRLNLTALATLSLLIGSFLIFNTVTFSVIQRREQIAMWRCLGMSRGQVATLLLTEVTLLGMLGSVFGIVLGYLVVPVTMDQVASTISSHYTPVRADSYGLAWASVVASFALGMGMSYIACILPVLEALQIRPRLAMSRTQLEDRIRRLAMPMAMVGVACLVVAGALCVVPSQSVALGFAAAFLVCGGGALMMPQLARVASATAGRTLVQAGYDISGLAVRNVDAALSRTAPALAALMVAIALVVGVGLMVQSFRQSLVNWIETTLRADVYIQPAARIAQRTQATMPPEMMQWLRSQPEVESVDTLRQRRIVVRDRPANLTAVDFQVIATRGLYPIIAGPANAIQTLAGSDAIIVSETLANFTGLSVGDALSLTTDCGGKAFQVAAIYRDYSTDGGQVMMDQRTFAKYWGETPPNSAALYLKSGSDAQRIADQVVATWGEKYAMYVRSNAALRVEILNVFDGTFAITYLIQILCIVVAAIGTASALLALMLERTKELATMLALGMSRGQLANLVISESLSIGVLATVGGLVVGVVLSAILIFVINVRSFGWTIDFHLVPSVLWSGVATALVSSILAAVWPVLRLRPSELVARLRED